MTRGRYRSLPKLSGNRTKRPAPGQMVIAETVSSANGKLRASGREKSVVSLRLSRAMLTDLDMRVEREREAGGGRYSYPPITRTTVIEKALREYLAPNPPAPKLKRGKS